MEKILEKAEKEAKKYAAEFLTCQDEDENGDIQLHDYDLEVAFVQGVKWILKQQEQGEQPLTD